MEYPIKLNTDLTVDHLDIEKLTWDSKQSYKGFTTAKVWMVHLWDGRAIEVIPSELDSGSWEVLTDIAFPG